MLKLAAPYARDHARPTRHRWLGRRSDGRQQEGDRETTLRDLFDVLRLERVTLVGGDVGGMVVYACLRHYGGLVCAAILHVIIHGVAPSEIGWRDPVM